MKKLLKSIKAFFNNIRGWMFSIKIIHLSSLNVIASIWGYGNWRYAKKYADKRHEIDGKRYYVLPSGPSSLIVFNSIEMKELKSKGFINKGVKIDVNALMHTAYYHTPNPTPQKAGSGKAKNNGK